MAFKLYNSPQSTCSQRVRFVLNAKEFPSPRSSSISWPATSSSRIILTQSEWRGAHFDHDGAIVIDSSVICEYLDEVAPAPTDFTPQIRCCARKCAH